MRRASLAVLALALAGSALAAQPDLKGERGDGEDRSERGEGRVTIAAVVINRTRMPTPRMAFQVRMDCWPTGQASIVVLSPPDGLVKSAPLRPRSRCVIAELPPPPPPGPCRWLTSYPDGREAWPGRRLRVVNELRCEGMGIPRDRRRGDGDGPRGW
ncbi:MAG: hypothetical protein ABW360_15755 [Phenylobacterium sp.]